MHLPSPLNSEYLLQISEPHLNPAAVDTILSKSLHGEHEPSTLSSARSPQYDVTQLLLSVLAV